MPVWEKGCGRQFLQGLDPDRGRLPREHRYLSGKPWLEIRLFPSCFGKQLHLERFHPHRAALFPALHKLAFDEHERSTAQLAQAPTPEVTGSLDEKKFCT